VADMGGGGGAAGVRQVRDQSRADREGMAEIVTDPRFDNDKGYYCLFNSPLLGESRHE